MSAFPERSANVHTETALHVAAAVSLGDGKTCWGDDTGFSSTIHYNPAVRNSSRAK
jgi:hypothetical protein